MAVSFPTTQWSQLAEASLHGGASAQAALDQLCRQYWQPVFQVFRFWGLELPHAQDATQGFFLYLMKASLFRRADPLRGKFRSFLCAALRQYAVDHYQRPAQRRLRQGAEEVPWETPGILPPTQEAPADMVFDREWALITLEAALERLRLEYEALRGPTAFALIRKFLPASPHRVPDYASAAALLHTTPAALRIEVHRLRTQFRTLLRREVARTVSAPHEIDEELLYLNEILHHD